MIEIPKVPPLLHPGICSFVVPVLFQTFPVDDQAFTQIALGQGGYLSWISFQDRLGAPMWIHADESDGQDKSPKGDDDLDTREEGPDEVFLMQEVVATLLKKDANDNHQTTEAHVEREAEGDHEIHLFHCQLNENKADSHLLDHLSQPDYEEEDQVVEEDVVDQCK